MTETKRPVLKLKLPIKVNPPQGLSKPAEVVKEPTAPSEAVAAKPKAALPPKAIMAKPANAKSIPRKVAPSKKMSIMPREEFNSMLEQVALKYPKVFAPKDKKVRIFAIKVHREVQAELGWSGKKTRKFFFIYCNSKKYKQARIKGANRYDLQGKVVGKVE